MFVAASPIGHFSQGLEVSMHRSLWLVVAALVFVPGVQGTGSGGGWLSAVDSGPGSFDVANIAELRAAVLALNGNRSGGSFA
jgi:hypothetical protein